MTVLTVFQMRIPDRVFFVYGTSVCLSSDEDKAAEESEHIDYENELSESNADMSQMLVMIRMMRRMMMIRI